MISQEAPFKLLGLFIVSVANSPENDPPADASTIVKILVEYVTFSGYKEIVPSIVVLPPTPTTILSAAEALNSMFVVELDVKFKSPETYKVPILLPGAIVPFVTVTLPAITPPPPNTALDPLSVTSVLKIVSVEDNALPAYNVPFETVTSPEIVLSPVKVNVPVPDLVKLPDPEKL